MTDQDWAKAVIMHLTGRPDDPTPMLLKMIADIRSEGRHEGSDETFERLTKRPT